MNVAANVVVRSPARSRTLSTKIVVDPNNSSIKIQYSEIDILREQPLLNGDMTMYMSNWHCKYDITNWLSLKHSNYLQRRFINLPDCNGSEELWTTEGEWTCAFGWKQSCCTGVDLESFRDLPLLRFCGKLLFITSEDDPSLLWWTPAFKLEQTATVELFSFMCLLARSLVLFLLLQRWSKELPIPVGRQHLLNDNRIMHLSKWHCK